MVVEPNWKPLEPRFACLIEDPVEFLTLNDEHQCPLGNQQFAPCYESVRTNKSRSIKRKY